MVQQHSSSASFQQSASYSSQQVAQMSSSTQSSSHQMSSVQQTSSSSMNQFNAQHQKQVMNHADEDQSFVPKFVHCSSDLEAMEGDQVRVYARVTGRPAPDLKLSDAGTIRCIATNRSGQSTFQCNLMVKSKAETSSPNFVQKLQNCKFELGQTITLSVKAVGEPIPRLSWLKDGIALQSGGNVTIAADNNGGSTGSAITRARILINIPHETTFEGFHQHEESYRLERPIGRRLEPEPQNEPEQKFGQPTFVTPLHDLTINEGDKIRFDAKISPVGDPSLTVEWFFNGNPIPSSSRMNSTCQFGFVSLDMLNSTTSDCGEYTCVIMNEGGTDHCSSQLMVRQRKEMETEFRSATQHVENRMATSTVVQEIKEPPPPKPEFVKPLIGVGRET
ncbi:TTN [Lepeophtheirus salmonis]|uniref:TTN n=1 Tax=Lepeophtheirus salmonis TaxID=72036 RepID=A0A7R8D480_LEPSM|nr:TTN [Lepeophtheirus salmonis]CAF2991806.1 TTN [Lepeophtheirus salmonis]